MTCMADGTGWEQTAYCFDMTPDCVYNSSTAGHECASLSPFDFENDFQLPDQMPEHRFRQAGSRAVPVQQLLDLASGFALA
jgi:hypothetical protein